MPRGPYKPLAEFSQAIYCSLLWIADTVLGTKQCLACKWGGYGVVCQQAEVVVTAVRHY